MVGSAADFGMIDAKTVQHVVLPEEKGFYNAALAQINLPRVVHRASIRDSEISQLTSDQKNTGSVLARLREFVRTHPAKSVEDRRHELKAQEELLIALDAALDELSREIGSLVDRVKDLRL